MQSRESYQIVFSSNKSTFETSFNPKIVLAENREYEVALVNLETYYSFPNVDTNNNNFRYSHDRGSTWTDINFAVGCYEILQIDSEIQRRMKANGHWDATNKLPCVTISANLSTHKSIISVTNTNYRVALNTDNTIGSILGFNKQVLQQGYHESENIVNIMKINTIYVNVDCIKSSYVNGLQSPVIYAFFPKVAPGHKIVEKPNKLIYLPLNKKEIRSINVWLTDQNGNELNLRGEVVTIRFHIRSK
jgi:hypothetical protein